MVLWDTLFAVDPTFDLIDLMCVAMLIRIRWTCKWWDISLHYQPTTQLTQHNLVLEADYSVCLQLLLKYPIPEAPHSPHTFVDDALYLKTHLNSSGGSSLVLKYTGKMPAGISSNASASAPTSRPVTPAMQGVASRQRNYRPRSPLPSPARFIQQQGGMEAIFQGAAKGVLERGEKLGINQAVRDAMGEFRRNVQGFQEGRYSPRTARSLLVGDTPQRNAAILEKRNKMLAGMLDETISNLKALTTSSLDDKVKSLEMLEIATAKIQFVKVYLEDSTIEVPELDSLVKGDSRDEHQDVVMGTTVEAPSPTIQQPPEDIATDAVEKLAISEDHDMETQKVEDISQQPASDPIVVLAGDGSTESPKPNPSLKERPSAPMPTRSSIAQSSFSWMLEPDSSVAHPSPSASSKSSSHRKRPSGNLSRERNAFLFGEITADSDPEHKVTADEIFGLEPIRKSKGV
jgi:TBC1 domain family member 5